MNPSHERRAYSIPEVEAMTTLSRATLYRAARAGQLTITKFGWRTVVLAADLDAFLTRPVVMS